MRLRHPVPCWIRWMASLATKGASQSATPGGCKWNPLFLGFCCRHPSHGRSLFFRNTEGLIPNPPNTRDSAATLSVSVSATAQARTGCHSTSATQPQHRRERAGGGRTTGGRSSIHGGQRAVILSNSSLQRATRASHAT
jgi:hypothetical protein